MRLLAIMLYVPGASRKEAAASVGMPEESVKTVLRRMFRDGFPALRDRRSSKAPFVGSLSPNPLQISARREDEDCIVSFGINGSTLKIPTRHRIQGRAVVLSLLNAGMLTVSESASALSISAAHCRELARKLASSDVADALIDKRVGQKQDYRVGPEQKAEIIQQLAARAITGQSVSSKVLAEQVNKRTEAELSARTVRWHINNLGLASVKNTLPQLVEALKKNSSRL